MTFSDFASPIDAKLTRDMIWECLKNIWIAKSWDIDYSSLIDSDVEKIQSTVYSKPLVYKYYLGQQT